MRWIARPLVVLLLAAASSCASSPPPKPKPRDDPELTRLSEWLKLDAEQQKKTRALLGELAERTARLREKLERQHRIRQEELLASRSVFLRDFVAILTQDQKRLFEEASLQMQTKGRGRPSF